MRSNLFCLRRSSLHPAAVMIQYSYHFTRERDSVLTNEDLLAISKLLDVKLDAKLEPLKVDIREMKNDITGIKLDIENDIQPQIQLLKKL